MNKFNLTEIINGCRKIYQYQGKCSLIPKTFHFKSDGTGFWIPVCKKDNSSWHGVSINISRNSPLGYTVEYSPMNIFCRRYKLPKDGCNVTRLVLKGQFFNEFHNFEALKKQILIEDAEYKSLIEWINKIQEQNK